MQCVFIRLSLAQAGTSPQQSLGDGTVPVLIELDRVVIYLTLEGTPSSLMRLELEPFDGEVDPDLITALAHHPHSRDVTVDGESWELLTLKRGSLPWASDVNCRLNLTGPQ